MDWLTAVLSFLTGLLTGWTLKVVVNKRSTLNKRVTKVTQSGNAAGGDIVAGDVNRRE
ncbi:hypothetical protein [Xanthomonas arboricola]|uniref:hypothetical protein n=1 Tax=Xanthomonas arboricola TaxID=56448 RepID=UPI0032E92CDE